MTNGVWAARVTPLLLSFLTEVGAAQNEWHAASTIDELVAVQASLKQRHVYVMLKPKIPHTAVRYPRDEFELDAFRTAESFSAYYHKHTVLRYREEIDEIMSPHRGDFANETTQLEILKKLVWFKRPERGPYRL